MLRGTSQCKRKAHLLCVQDTLTWGSSIHQVIRATLPTCSLSAREAWLSRGSTRWVPKAVGKGAVGRILPFSAVPAEICCQGFAETETSTLETWICADLRHLLLVEDVRARL